MNHYLFTKKASIFWNRSSSINFFVMLVFRIDYVVCWHETFLTDCPFCKPSSRVIPAYPWLFCYSVLRQLKNHFPVDTIRYRPFVQPVVMSSVKSWSWRNLSIICDKGPRWLPRNFRLDFRGLNNIYMEHIFANKLPRWVYNGSSLKPFKILAVCALLDIKRSAASRVYTRYGTPALVLSSI